jgi:K+-transporting ATPase ATPase A chain
LPAALVFTYGKMLGNKKHAWTIFGVMMFVFVTGVAVSYWSEVSSSSALQTTQLMEGKEARFGVFNSVLWSAATTAASNGSVNAMHSSISPMISGFVISINIQWRNYFWRSWFWIIWNVFIHSNSFYFWFDGWKDTQNILVKIESYEIKWAIIGILIPSGYSLFTAIGVTTNGGLTAY